MKDKIDLVLIGNPEKPVKWNSGKIWHSSPDISDVNDKILKILDTSDAEYVFFQDSEYDPVLPQTLNEIVNTPGDVWHYGMTYFSDYFFKQLSCIVPGWMFLNNSREDVDSTSWKLTFRRCLLKKDVLSHMGTLNSSFTTLDWACLDYGYRCLAGGVFPRNSVKLKVNHSIKAGLNNHDEFKFICRHFSLFWVLWSSLASGFITHPLREIPFFLSRKQTSRKKPGNFQSKPDSSGDTSIQPAISILIPTLERPGYLESLLLQIQEQTLKPHDVIIVDQSREEYQGDILKQKHLNFKIKYFHRPVSGQSTARNFGLKHVKGEYILFLDDDIKIEKKFIENHYQNLIYYNADASIGSIIESDSPPIPESIKISEVFPTGNSLIKKSLLEKTGHFDLAFDKGPRADLDLGMRIYQQGGLMVYNSAVTLFHYRAPQGGLRVHKARKVTLQSSKKSFFLAHLPSVTECYILLKYFTRKNLNVFLIIRLIGTVRIDGGIFKKIIKLFIATILFPYHCFKIISIKKKALIMYDKYSHPGGS